MPRFAAYSTSATSGGDVREMSSGLSLWSSMMSQLSRFFAAKSSGYTARVKPSITLYAVFMPNRSGSEKPLTRIETGTSTDDEPARTAILPE